MRRRLQRMRLYRYGIATVDETQPSTSVFAGGTWTWNVLNVVSRRCSVTFDGVGVVVHDPRFGDRQHVEFGRCYDVLDERSFPYSRLCIQRADTDGRSWVGLHAGHQQ